MLAVTPAAKRRPTGQQISLDAAGWQVSVLDTAGSVSLEPGLKLLQL